MYLRYCNEPKVVYYLPKGLLLPSSLKCVHEFDDSYALQPNFELPFDLMKNVYIHFFNRQPFTTDEAFIKHSTSLRDLSFYDYAPTMVDLKLEEDKLHGRLIYAAKNADLTRIRKNTHTHKKKRRPDDEKRSDIKFIPVSEYMSQ